MSKTVMIPKIGANPYVVELNGVRYSYPAGTYQTVPDAVAAIIANDIAMRPKEDPDAQARRAASVRELLDLQDLMYRITAGLTGRVEQLERDAESHYHVEFSGTVDPDTGAVSVTTEETFAVVQSILTAGGDVVADVTIGDLIFTLPRMVKTPADDVAAVIFAGAVDLASAGEPADVRYLHIGFAAGGVDARLLTIKTEE